MRLHRASRRLCTNWSVLFPAVDLTQLASESTRMQATLRQVDAEVKKHEADGAADRFAPVMREFSEVRSAQMPRTANLSCRCCSRLVRKLLSSSHAAKRSRKLATSLRKFKLASIRSSRISGRSVYFGEEPQAMSVGAMFQLFFQFVTDYKVHSLSSTVKLILVCH